MAAQIDAIKAEVIKCRHAGIVWLTMVAFGLAPVMGGIFMVIVSNPDALAKAGSLNAKAQAMNFSADWKSYFAILTQALGIGGILVFGFAASWIFGREYTDGTAKDLLSLPVSRVKILNAKFVVYFIWCAVLAFTNLLLGAAIGFILNITLPNNFYLPLLLQDYLITALMTIALGTPIAFFALLGRGYLAPLGFVSLTLVFAQIIAATGYGNYFPWAVPGLFSGAGGEYKWQLNFFSYFMVAATTFAGYVATIMYWRLTDHTK